MEYETIAPDEFDKFVRLETARYNKGYFITDKTEYIKSMVDDLSEYRKRTLYLHRGDANRIASILDEWYSYSYRMTSGGLRYLVLSDTDKDTSVKLMRLYKEGKFRKNVLVGGKW